ncbi:uncharacterized protein LOC142775466 [Rhipicephalus microplus]|uniref:uncharacterized protein LOC142775466 n=1 Tax=Rhipicephalus microplus TaxID=6941 RepID=UPI003F6D65BA
MQASFSRLLRLLGSIPGIALTGFSSPSTVLMETPSPGTGGCFSTAGKEGYVTYWTHPQQELEHGMGALDQPSFVPAQNVLERTTDRCSIAPALGYVAFIGVRHDPNLFVCHDAARNSSLCNSRGRPADQGRANQNKLDWKDTLFATKAPSVHSNPSRRLIAAPLNRWATYAPAAEKSSGEVTGTSEELAQTLRKATGRHWEMWPCNPMPAGERRSETVAEFGNPLAEQCVPVGDSRSCSCVADNSGVVQQDNRRPLQRA